MELTEGQVRLIGMVGFALLVIGTPVATVYAMDYRMVETGGPMVDPPVLQYSELTDEQRAAVDRTLDGDGPWYRTRADAPFSELPVRVVQEGELHDEVHEIGLMEQYHWGAWYGKLPLVSLLSGLLCIAFTIRNRIRNHGALPRGA